MSVRLALGVATAMLLVLPAQGHDNDLTSGFQGLSSPRWEQPGVSAPPPPGAHLETAPSRLPDLDAGLPTLSAIQGHMRAGDTTRALALAERFVARHPWGRERDAAWLLIGLLEREEGRPNAASAAFTRVRYAQGPLTSWGAWYEAEQDLARGKTHTAIKECEQYRATWPEGLHASACLRLIARAWAREGQERSALAAAAEWDAAHPEETITEQIEVQLARWQAEHEPEAAVRRLRRLAVDHRAPLTGRYAEELLAELAARGVADATVPDDTASLKRRAISLRDSGRIDEAWAAYEVLLSRAADDVSLQRWVEAEVEPFAWRTRRHGFLADLRRAEYAARPTGDTAWSIYRLLGRAGRYDEASDIALTAQAAHGATRHWRHSHEDVGRTMMLAGRYEDAVAQLDAAAAHGGWTGRRARYEAAFAAWMGGQLGESVERFDAIVEDGRGWVTEARYWRARALDDLGEPERAFQDRQWILENDPSSWYALLVRQDDPDLPELRPFARDGRWPGAALPTFPEPAVPLEVSATAPPAAPAVRDLLAGTAAFGALTWPMRAAPLPERPPAPLVARDLLSPPSSYRPGTWFDEEEAARSLSTFATTWGEDWPELQAIHDLVAVGLYDLAGPWFGRFYEEWDDALRTRWHPKHHVARSMKMRQEDWRPLFLVTRDHHHAARFLHGLDQDARTERDRRHALQLAHPLAYDRFVWSHAREQDIDPYLVLGLMRQESVYDANALSRVGARGAMQIMPRTGHLLADLAHDTTFTAADLEDPILAIDYGLRYLDLLMERYAGVYPLAVASYNGGPHNVHAWLQGTGYDMPIDAFVEHIPFRETQGYVKKVSENYATYLALYAPEGTAVVVPERPRGDDPSVVDF